MNDNSKVWGEMAGALLGMAPTETTVRVLEAVVPIALRYGNQRAVEALRDAAADVDDGEFSDRRSDAVRRSLLARANEIAVEDPS